MNKARFTAEFKAEAIKQITERGHGVVKVSKRLTSTVSKSGCKNKSTGWFQHRGRTHIN